MVPRMTCFHLHKCATAGRIRLPTTPQRSTLQMLSTRLKHSGKSTHVHGVQLSLRSGCAKSYGRRRTRASKQAMRSNHVPVLVVRRNLPFVIWLTSTINGCFTHSKVWRRHPNYASILVRLSSLGVKVRVFLVQLASELVAKGQKKYDSGDRMGALKLWEQALSRDPTVEDRQAALFNSTCVHASFGDVEFAQVTLRDAINCGLDFEDAMRSSDYVKLNSSPQVIIQLRKFAQAAKRIRDAVGAEASAPRLAKAVTKGEIKPGDLSDILGTEIRDGMDTSAFGILRRVLIIILVATVGGTALFFLGLKFAFPEYR